MNGVSRASFRKLQCSNALRLSLFGHNWPKHSLDPPSWEPARDREWTLGQVAVEMSKMRSVVRRVHSIHKKMRGAIACRTSFRALSSMYLLPVLTGSTVGAYDIVALLQTRQGPGPEVALPKNLNFQKLCPRRSAGAVRKVNCVLSRWRVVNSKFLCSRRKKQNKNRNKT